MNIRHLVTKSFDSEDQVRDSLIVEGAPYVFQLESNLDNRNMETLNEEVSVVFDENLPEEFNLSKELISGKDAVKKCPVGSIICDENGNVKPLSQLYDFRVTELDEFSKVLPVNTTFNLIFENKDMKDYMLGVCDKMFPYTNPLSHTRDVNPDDYYAPYIPLSILTGVLTPQLDDNGHAFFNPNGTVSVAEFLDSLNAIKFGANSNLHRKKSIDNISTEDDYFNEGYQECIRGISSPFYNLYTREELVRPITRLEMAYITVICWNRFIEKFNNIYSNPYYIGINFDWEHPYEYVSKYKDGMDYKISQIYTNKRFKVISLNVKDYKKGISMTEYKADLLYGKRAIPLPMFMSLIELGTINLFKYNEEPNVESSDLYLNPMKELSRGELCYFVTMLAKLFPTRYEK